MGALVQADARLPRTSRFDRRDAVILESAEITRQLRAVLRWMISAIPVAGSSDHGQRFVDRHPVCK